MGNEVECMEVVKLRGLRLKSGQVKTEEVEMLKQMMEMSYDKRRWGRKVAFEGSHVSAKLFEEMALFPSITYKRVGKSYVLLG